MAEAPKAGSAKKTAALSIKAAGKRFDAAPGTPGDGWSAWAWEQRPGGWCIGTRRRAKSNGEEETERVRVAYAERRGSFWAQLPSLPVAGEWIVAQRGGAGAAGSDADLVAQFPGKVRKLLVKAGEKVTEGQPLVLVEAMKMEFAVKAPAAGTVKKLLVTEGQQLQPGDRFVELASAEPGPA
ncbi:MAG: acetyl-CoA carboxylase biotin carboxyl carrier protein subunit [Bdellovibrionales bacterium]|nr:acetyl-CoA carboxylase biotin carboxyl carrier protein subunit [Bdellovibrionales bacterium]